MAQFVFHPLISAATLILLGSLFPAKAKATEPKYVLCRNNKTVRTIRVEPAKDGEPCVATYTKFGVDQVVGSGRFDVTCNKVMDNIRENLERASWVCKDVDDSQVTRSTASE